MTPQKPIERHGMRPSVSAAKELLARLVGFDTTSHKTNILSSSSWRGISPSTALPAGAYRRRMD